jgi:protein-tyrosine phosphatase
MSELFANLILASFEESFDKSILAKYKVTHVLNVASECNVSERVGLVGQPLVYAKHGIEDDCLTADIAEILPYCMHFIKEAHSNGGVVLVHCLEGKSRSVCVCAAYMVLALYWDWTLAINHIQSKRNIDIFPRYEMQTKGALIFHFPLHL